MVLSKDLKIAICFGLIIGVILSVCNLCFATESIEPSFASNCGFTVGGTEFVERNASTRYFLIEKGYLYHINNGSSYSQNIGFADDIPSVGESVYDTFRLNASESFDFTYEQFSYLAVCSYDGFNVTLTREPITGMDGFIDNLAYSLTVNGVWDTVLACVPLIAICVLFGFGVFNIVRFLRLIIKIRGGM